MRLKKLPSMKEKKRYVVFRIHSEEKVDFPNMRNAVWNSLENWLGERDLAQANVHIIKNLWDSREQKGFIKCSHRFVDEVKVGLGLIHQIGDSRVIFQTLRVTGTIKSGKKKSS
jgi:ribonuclease P/MRP protein subunit POP5